MPCLFSRGNNDKTVKIYFLQKNLCPSQPNLLHSILELKGIKIFHHEGQFLPLWFFDCLLKNALSQSMHICCLIIALPKLDYCLEKFPRYANCLSNKEMLGDSLRYSCSVFDKSYLNRRREDFHNLDIIWKGLLNKSKIFLLEIWKISFFIIYPLNVYIKSIYAENSKSKYINMVVWFFTFHFRPEPLCGQNHCVC